MTTATETTMIRTPDEVIAEKVNEQLIAHDYSKVKDDKTVPDEDKMKARVFELVSGRIVSNKEEKSKKSWTNGELYAAVFPEGPGTNPRENLDLLSFEDLGVRNTLMRKVWGLTNPQRSGYVQKRLPEVGNYVLCRSQVMRGLDPIQGCFVTDNHDLIMSDSLQPQIEALVRKADNLRRHTEMIGTRLPELEARMTAALGVGIDRTVAALPKGSANGGEPAGRESKSPKNTK